MTVPVYSILDTWNAGATTFTGIGLNVTDTASASASKLLDLQVGGASQFAVQKDGVLSTPFRQPMNAVTPAGTTQAAAAAITGDLNFLAGGSTDNGVVLPAAIAGRSITIINASNLRYKVYPASGEKWGGQSGLSAADVPAYLPDSTVGVIYCTSAGVWRSSSLWQFAAGTFGLGTMIQTGTGSTASGARTALQTPSGVTQLSLQDSDGIYGAAMFLDGTSFWMRNGNKLRFANGGETATLTGTNTGPDLVIGVAGSSSGAIVQAARFKSAVSGVNNLLSTAAATGNGIKLEAEGSDTNIDLIINPKGTGNLQLGGSSWVANGAVATTLSGLGPVGSHTTVQEWFAVKNASGVVRYIAAF